MTAGAFLLFESLLPTGAGEACASFVATQGRHRGQLVDVLLVDVGRAEARATRGQALALPPARRARLMLSLCAPEQTLALVRALGSEVSVELVTPDGTLPQAFAELAQVRAIAPGDVDIFEVDHYGELEREILSNGAAWQDLPTPVCVRPQRASVVGQSDRQLLRDLDRHLESCRAAWPQGAPSRALSLALRSARLFDDPPRLRRLRREIAERGVWLSEIALAEPSALALALALEEQVQSELAGRPLRLSVEPDGEPWARAAARVLGSPGARAEALHSAWLELEAESDEQRLARRLLDDLTRRTVFSRVRENREIDQDRAEGLLGSARSWAPALKRHLNRGAPRVVVVPTWQCELRCMYCTIPKQDGRVMSPPTLQRAIDLLMSSAQPDLELHFFGGEPFLEWPLLQHACRYGSSRAARMGSRMQFIFTTNGYSLDRDMVRWLADYDVRFQLSIDGDVQTQNTYRRTLTPGLDSYRNSPAQRATWFRDAGIAHDVIQVVHPRNTERMRDNFFHLVDMGYRRIQLNFALGTRWPRDAIERYAQGLHAIGLELEQRWQLGHDIELVNLGETLARVRTNVELTVDFDGSIFGSNAFLYIPKFRDKFLLGHLDDEQSFERYALHGLCREDLLSHWYKDGMAENNQQVGAVVESFVRWMRGRHPERYGDGSQAAID